MTEWKSGMFEHVVWAGMSQKEVKVRIQFARLDRLNGMNEAGKGKKVRRGGAKGKERWRGGGQEVNAIQWVNTSDHTKEFTGANVPKGKATGPSRSRVLRYHTHVQYLQDYTVPMIP
jgi:hypothetical protein